MAFAIPIQIAMMAIGAATSMAQAAAAAKAQQQQAKMGAIAAQLEQIQFEGNADMAKIEALQAERDRREEFKFAGSARLAQAAAAGIPIGQSQSFAAIQKGDDANLRRDVRSIQSQGRANVHRAMLGAMSAGIQKDFLRSRAKSSALGGVLMAGLGSIASGVSQMSMLGGPSTTTTPGSPWARQTRYGPGTEL